MSSGREGVIPVEYRQHFNVCQVLTWIKLWCLLHSGHSFSSAFCLLVSKYIQLCTVHLQSKHALERGKSQEMLFLATGSHLAQALGFF